MSYPDDANGDVFRRMEADQFDFDQEHVVDFFAILENEADADYVAMQFVADHEAGDEYATIETRPHDEGGTELTLSKRMLVTYTAVCAMEDLLATRVAEVEGYLDGWGVMQE